MGLFSFIKMLLIFKHVLKSFFAVGVAWWSLPEQTPPFLPTISWHLSTALYRSKIRANHIRETGTGALYNPVNISEGRFIFPKPKVETWDPTKQSVAQEKIK